MRTIFRLFCALLVAFLSLTGNLWRELAFRTYNGTGRYAYVEFQETLPDDSVRKYDGCFAGFWGYFTRPFTVTKVTFHEDRPSDYAADKLV